MTGKAGYRTAVSVEGRGEKNGKKDKIKESLLVPKCGYYLKAVEMGVACEMR